MPESGRRDPRDLSAAEQARAVVALLTPSTRGERATKGVRR